VTRRDPAEPPPKNTDPPRPGKNDPSWLTRLDGAAGSEGKSRQDAADPGKIWANRGEESLHEGTLGLVNSSENVPMS